MSDNLSEMELLIWRCSLDKFISKRGGEVGILLVGYELPVRKI